MENEEINFEDWNTAELFDYLISLKIIDEDEEFEDWKNDRTDMLDMARDCQ